MYFKNKKWIWENIQGFCFKHFPKNGIWGTLYVVMFLTFEKRLNMSSLIANKVKKLCFGFNQLFIVHTIYVCHCSQFIERINVYNNNNYSWLFLSHNYSLFAILLTTVLFTHNASSHKTDWITTTVVCFVLLFYRPIQSV